MDVVLLILRVALGLPLAGHGRQQTGVGAVAVLVGLLASAVPLSSRRPTLRRQRLAEVGA